MQAPRQPDDDRQRLATLRALGILDTPNEERFDRVTRLAQHMFEVPIALVSLVDEDRQWFKSNQGLPVAETPREISFCGHAILQDEPLVIPNALEDERFSGNPLVTNDPHIRFYAGHPLCALDGHKLGTLCLIDTKPREFTDDQRSMLRDLSEMVQRELMVIQVATSDSLTGLANRHGFIAVATKAFSICTRLKRPALLMYFDLDGLKSINDQHGHAAGDRALWEFGEHLREVFRASDVVARVGGDEFCVLLTGTDTGKEALARLRARIDVRNGDPLEAFSLDYTVGAVGLDPERHATLADLVSDADSAMYANK